MSPLTLKRFTAFAWGHDNPAPEVWVNPAQIAYVEPRIVTRGHAESTDGTRIYFQQEAGVLDVREPIGYVVQVVQSGKGGVCRDCYQLLDEAWRSVCDDCRSHHHAGVDADPEEAAA
jgi:hypothetical protein